MMKNGVVILEGDKKNLIYKKVKEQQEKVFVPITSAVSRLLHLIDTSFCKDSNAH